MDKLQAMALFLEVVNHGGFAKAARHLDISPPMATRAVADLENLLGTPLLTRTTRVVRVTESGATYARECQAILAAVAEAEARASGQATSVRGVLRVTASVTFGQMHLMPVIAEYLKRWPDVEVAGVFVDRITNLVDEGIDVAVRIGHLPDSSLIATRVGSVSRILVASPAYLATRGTPTDVSDLHGHCLIATGATAEACTWHLGAADRRTEITFRPRLRCNSVGASIAAAEAGLGIARLLSYQVADAVIAGRLQRVLPEAETEPDPVHVVFADAQQRTLKLKSFIELATRTLRGSPALQWPSLSPTATAPGHAERPQSRRRLQRP